MKYFIFLSILFVLKLSAQTFEYCASSRINYLHGAKGGVGGHAFVYVEGLCKDYSKKFPQVIPCSQAHNPRYLEHSGVGISLDSSFKNINWVAVPGRDLFLFGSKNRNLINLNTDRLSAVVSEALRLKIFEGVQLHDAKTDLPQEDFLEVLENLSAHTIKVPGQFFNSSNFVVGTRDYEVFAALNAVGTDLAVNWGRDIICTKVRVEEKYLSDLSNYLNKTNQYYQSGHDYIWSAGLNQCAHLSTNIAYVLHIGSTVYNTEYQVAAGYGATLMQLLKNTKQTWPIITTPIDSYLKIKKASAKLSREVSFYKSFDLTGKNNIFVNEENLRALSLTHAGPVSIQSLE